MLLLLNYFPCKWKLGTFGEGEGWFDKGVKSESENDDGSYIYGGDDFTTH